MATDAQKKASAKYDRDHTKAILFKFNVNNDADILTKLDEVGNKQGYVKELIRRNIRGDGNVLSIESIRLMMMPMIQKHCINRAFLFGSYARGSATASSDVDLLIECETIRDMTEYLSLKDGLEGALGKSVDIVLADSLYSDTSRKGKRLLDHIERDKVIIYERTQ